MYWHMGSNRKAKATVAKTETQKNIQTMLIRYLTRVKKDNICDKHCEMSDCALGYFMPVHAFIVLCGLMSSRPVIHCLLGVYTLAMI